MSSARLATKGLFIRFDINPSTGLACDGLMFYILQGTTFTLTIPHFLTKRPTLRKFRAVNPNTIINFLGHKKVSVFDETPEIITKRSWVRKR